MSVFGYSLSAHSSPRAPSCPPPPPPLLLARSQQQPSLRPHRGTGSRKVAQPVSAATRPLKRQGKRHSWNGRSRDTGSCSSVDGESAPFPGGGPEGKSFFPLLGCSAISSPASGTQTFRAVFYVSSSKGGEDSSARDTVSKPPSPSSFASEQQGPVRGRNAFSPATCPAVEPGKGHSAFPDPTSGCVAFRVGSLCSTSLHHREYVGGSPGNHQTRLHDSVCQASFRVQFTSVLNKDAPVLRVEIAVLLAKDVIEPVPPAEVKSGLYSPYFIVPVTVRLCD